MKIILLTILFGSLVFVLVASILGYWINLKYFANECLSVLKDCIAHLWVSVSEFFRKRVRLDKTEQFWHEE